jgi:hypothetical protein
MAVQVAVAVVTNQVEVVLQLQDKVLLVAVD